MSKLDVVLARSSGTVKLFKNAFSIKDEEKREELGFAGKSWMEYAEIDLRG
jgi:hypothetical protein